jgi:hypothetical protein
MSFGPSALQGLSVSGAGGRVEYRLARNAVVSEFKKGRLSRLDVCDAHPELLRAARNVGAVLTEDCPICEETAVVHVTYVFGARLPKNGRCPTRSWCTWWRCAQTVRGTTSPACTQPAVAIGPRRHALAAATAERTPYGVVTERRAHFDRVVVHH